MNDTFSIGLDYGTNSVRGVVIRTRDGAEMASHVHAYEEGDAGIITDASDPNVARQHPRDYIRGMEMVMRGLLAKCDSAAIPRDAIVGIGIDTTGSTPIPVDATNTPLAFLDPFRDNPDALAWLWKDHTAIEEARLITETSLRLDPRRIALCGNTYSPEWFFAKILHCLRTDRRVFDAACSWVECCDFVPAVLCGITDPRRIMRGVCAAGHKAMYHDSLGGLPDERLLTELDPALAALRPRLYDRAYPSDHAAGTVCARYKEAFGFTRDIPVAVGGFDAHHGAVGAGVDDGALVKIIGTSTCDITIDSRGALTGDIPGVCGVVDGSVMPGARGIEAGQSAVGDILNWYVSRICEADDGYHATLADRAAQCGPGESGLLALDWHNGNRTVLVDAALTGLMIGQTLHTTRAEIYRALIESTAFGARAIIERIREYHVPVNSVIACGGISQKNPLFMQIYADVIGKPMLIADSTQTCALGAAMFGATVGGAFRSAVEARNAMRAGIARTYTPDPARARVYDRLYALYRHLHDSFGTVAYARNSHHVMKELLRIKKETRA